MKKLFTLILLLLVISTTYGQFGRGGRQQRNINRIPQNTEPTEAQIEARKKEMEERKQEYISNFLETLEADEFQKEIVKQTLNSYFDEVKKFKDLKFDTREAQKDASDLMTKNHFKEVKLLVSEADMQKIDNFTQGKFDEKKEKKKKRKRRKKKKKN